jgi:glucan endo-1,6-beta-glucosidase
MATNIHTNSNFRNVGMLEIVNEPVQNAGSVGAMRSSYYPNAFSRIRAAENALGVTSNNYLHIQMMNNKWGSGDPTQYLTDNYFAAYDDHRYLKWSGIPTSQSSYISTSCSDDRGGNWPTIVGEFSLSVPDNVQWTDGWNPNSQQGFYKQWFAAQAMAYEKQMGWIFWSWKSQLGDYRWAYQDAVAAGVIPTDLNSVYNEGAC